jgi:hypothetical protein
MIWEVLLSQTCELVGNGSIFIGTTRLAFASAIGFFPQTIKLGADDFHHSSWPISIVSFALDTVRLIIERLTTIFDVAFFCEGIFPLQGSLSVGSCSVKHLIVLFFLFLSLFRIGGNFPFCLNIKLRAENTSVLLSLNRIFFINT